jgi:hypothetical protein
LEQKSGVTATSTRRNKPNSFYHPLIESQSSKKFQARGFRSKVRNMFTWKITKATKQNDDIEVGEDNEDENAEIYHFDHGSPSFYRTTDCPPHLMSDMIAQRTNHFFTKFWAEFFGSINVVVTCLIAFLIQFYR